VSGAAASFLCIAPHRAGLTLPAAMHGAAE
jgi:hypothetical protein